MKQARMLGSYVFHLAKQQGLSISDLSKIMNCSERQVYLFLHGRAFASFLQIQSLSNELNVSVEKLLKGNEKIYYDTFVHFYQPFHDLKNCEMILDIIDNYITIKESLCCAE